MNPLFVTEVFSAIQGEGALVGHRQVFLRLTGCPLRCAYCDQPESLVRAGGPCLIERNPGGRNWEQFESPVAGEVVVDTVDRLWQALPHHSVSITGGEPLMQSGRLAELLPHLKARGHRIFLETSGTLVEGLARVLEHLDHVSMDIKLDSVDGQSVDLEVHRRFLATAAHRADTYVKIVLGPDTDVRELLAAGAMVVSTAPGCEVFLQPVTPFAAVESAPTPSQVLEWQAALLRLHPGRVRVIPQTHKSIDQR